jgi:DNA helicase-2/ATP-dependent DNA helicase PcrA
MESQTEPIFRKEQEDIILGYTHGRVGVAAVPGSGKTFTLAHLAARLVAGSSLDADQEVLVVTFTNTAVNSFQARIAKILRDQYSLPPYVGYRVRTLHGLAHDIVRERPALVGLAEDFVILDEKSALEIQRDIVVQLFSEWWDRLISYTDPDQNPKSVRRQFEQDLPDLVTRFVQRAKDVQLDPEELSAALLESGGQFDLARFATQAYSDYQRSLTYRGAVDFDDLVRLALRALQMDKGFLRRLQERWPYILEDEAQDSSRLQEEMLYLLSANRNWVRVGDPNQAINTTFTTADPQHLLNFLNEPGVIERPLSVSGRSTPSIVALANRLVRWTVREHPAPSLRDAFEYEESKKQRRTLRGLIQVTPRGDPQPNPAEGSIHIEYEADQRISPDKELEMVVAGEEFALAGWLKDLEEIAPEARPTVAVLVPENSRGFKLAEILRKHGIQYEELLRSTTATRQAVTLLRTVLEYLIEPADLKALKQLYWALMPEELKEAVRDDLDLRQVLNKLFARLGNIEEFLWPAAGVFALDLGEITATYPWLPEDLELFRVRVRHWLEATSLPVDQLVLTIGQDLFTTPIDVALTYKVAVLLRDMAQNQPGWRLRQFVEELRIISNNERKFIGFDDAEAGYEPKPGVVTIATMHAAKGLEWDRVYLMAVSNYGFPSAQVYDSYIGERWYVRDSLNLEAEVLAQLDVLQKREPDSYNEGEATLEARLDYAKERLRLLYVGITRARRDLIVTWNMGRFWQEGRTNQPALPLIALSEYVKQNGIT